MFSLPSAIATNSAAGQWTVQVGCSIFGCTEGVPWSRTRNQWPPPSKSNSYAPLVRRSGATWPLEARRSNISGTVASVAESVVGMAQISWAPENGNRDAYSVQLTALVTCVPARGTIDKAFDMHRRPPRSRLLGIAWRIGSFTRRELGQRRPQASAR